MDDLGIAAMHPFRTELDVCLAPWWQEPWVDTTTMKGDITRNGRDSVYITSVFVGTERLVELVAGNTTSLNNVARRLAMAQ